MPDDKVSVKRTAARVRKTRLSKQLTQVEVAKKAGISETYYAQIERGKRNPTTSVFLSIIKALDVSSKDILGKMIRTLGIDIQTNPCRARLS